LRRAVDTTPVDGVAWAGGLSGLLRRTGSRTAGLSNGPPLRRAPRGGALLRRVRVTQARCPSEWLQSSLRSRRYSSAAASICKAIQLRSNLSDGCRTLPLSGLPPSRPSLARPGAPLVPASFRSAGPSLCQGCRPSPRPSLGRAVPSGRPPSDDSDPSSVGAAVLPPIPLSGRQFVCPCTRLRDLRSSAVAQASPPLAFAKQLWLGCGWTLPGGAGQTTGWTACDSCPSDKVRQQLCLAKLPSFVAGPADPKVHLLGFEPGSSVLKSSPITAQPSVRYWIYFHAWCSSGVTSLEVSSPGLSDVVQRTSSRTIGRRCPTRGGAPVRRGSSQRRTLGRRLRRSGRTRGP